MDFTVDKKINQELIRFMALISMKNSYLPDHFMFEFEITRLEFSERYGFIRNVQPQQSKMLITLFLIIKLLIVNVIL